MAQRVREPALSRSAFFERFSRTVGIAPREYLHAWRMAIAKQMLRQGELAMAAIAKRTGCSSVSAFGVAFSPHVGIPPGRDAKTEVDDMQIRPISG